MNRGTAFEQGPIRPPNEARSLLLRITRNCPWNRCLFCPVYKGRKFSLRSVVEIKADIQIARDMADRISDLSWSMGLDGKVDDRLIGRIFNDPDASEQFRGVAMWMYFGTGACFLQDADNLIVPTSDLIAVLRFLRQSFPEIQRVTTYTRSRSVLRKSLEDLTQIRRAGLDRVHIGLESGCDAVLKLMQKGVRAAQHIEAGLRCRQAGLELSEYVMPGLGGRQLWREHAVDTAAVLNAINPHFIRLRSLRVPQRVPLYQKLADGSFTLQTDDGLAREVGLLIASLDGITSTVSSDHIMNLLEEVSGTLPQDKAAMLAVVDRYLALDDRDRLIFRAGRRGGAFRSTDDLARDPATYQKIKQLIETVAADAGPQGVEQFITELADRYV
jgi:hypothetical protein